MVDKTPRETDATASARRQRWMAVLAMAATEDLEDHLQKHGGAPEYTWIRPPEFGAVMAFSRRIGRSDAARSGTPMISSL